jgi:hypothetical protein
MARLAPTNIVVKSLFALSRNQCAFTDCHIPIICEGVVIGEICHIEAANEGGQRYNKDKNNDELRDFANLMLMCPVHHKLTDDTEQYPVEKLRQMKVDHEAASSGNINSFSEAMIEKVISTIIANWASHPQTIINNYYGQQPTQSRFYYNLDVLFWDKICQRKIQKEKYLLGLYAQEGVICSAIIHGLVAPIDYSMSVGFSAEENTVSTLELYIERSLREEQYNLVLITSPPGAGKTTMLYKLAYHLYSKYPVIRIAGKLPAESLYIADQGIILLDEISMHFRELTHFRIFFETAFPKGFVLIIAEQPIKWDLFNDGARMFRQFENVVKVNIQPKPSSLETLVQKISQLLGAGEQAIVIPYQLRKDLLSIADNDTRTVADRLIDLYHALGLGQVETAFLTPDWVTIAQLNQPALSDLYTLTAYLNTIGEDLDMRIFEDDAEKYSGVLNFIRTGQDHYPLRQLEGSNRLRLRHSKLADWYFREKPEQLLRAQMLFRPIFRNPHLSPERISLLRKFYQAGAQQFLNWMSWDDMDYYNALSTYHRHHQFKDFNLQARKSFHESLKILFRLKRWKYEQVVQEYMETADTDEKQWLCLTMVKNLITAGETSAARLIIAGFRTNDWAPANLHYIEQKVCYEEAMRSIRESGKLTAIQINTYPVNVISRLIEELSGTEYRNLPEVLFQLHDHYFKHSLAGHRLPAPDHRKLLITHCRQLSDRRQFKQIIDLFGSEPYQHSGVLLAFLGHAVLHYPQYEAASRFASAKDLILQGFQSAAENLTTVIYLDKLLVKGRIIFSDEELIAIRQKIEEVQHYSAHPIYYKCLSDVVRRQLDHEASQRILREALERYPWNDRIRSELITQLLQYKSAGDNRWIKNEVEQLMADFRTSSTGYFKILAIRYHHRFFLDDRQTHMEKVLELLKELRRDSDFEATANFLSIRTSFLSSRYRECLRDICRLFFDLGIYDDYEIGNYFYLALLQSSKSSDEDFKANCVKHRRYINNLLRDTTFEMNDYFRYVSYIVNRDYEQARYKDRIEEIEQAFKEDNRRALNVSLLEAVVDFLFHTSHFNSIRKLIQITKGSGNEAHLTPQMHFNFKVCSVISNNRFFIEGPRRESKSFLLFPTGMRENDLYEMTDRYIDIFYKLGYHRRGIIFCYCLLKSYPAIKWLQKRAASGISGHLRMLYQRGNLAADGKDCRGFVYCHPDGRFSLRNGTGYFRMEKDGEGIRLDPGKAAKNWSYFSMTNKQLAIMVEPGFVLDGYPSDDPEQPNAAFPGCKFDQWLEMRIRSERHIFVHSIPANSKQQSPANRR